MCAPGFAVAAPAWRATQTLSSPGRDASAPKVAISRTGEMVAVWQGSDGSNDRVEASVRRPGEPFGAVQTLSDPGADALRPDIALDTEGNALAVWQRHDGAHSRVEASLRPADAQFGAAQRLSDGSRDSFGARVSAGARRFVIAWYDSDGLHASVRAVVHDTGTGFGAVQTLSPAAAFAVDPGVSVDQSGGAAVAWRQADSAGSAVEVAALQLGGAFADPQRVSAAGANVRDPEVATDATGGTIAVWRQVAGGRSRVAAALRTGGSFGVPQLLSDPGTDAFGPAASVGADGTMSVAWFGASGGERRIAASLRPAGSAFGAARAISAGTGGNALDPRVGIDGQGRALVAWYRWTGSAYEVEWAFRDPSSGFASARAISPSSQSALDPDVAVSAAGAAALAWSRFDGTSFRVEAAVADASAIAPEPIPIPPPPPLPPPPPADLRAPPALATLADRVAPAVSGFAVTPRFAVAATPTPLTTAFPRRGGRVRFSISEPASVSIQISPAARPELVRGSLVRRYGSAGAKEVPFSGRLGSRALGPGRYAAMIQATDAAGNRSPLRGDAFKVVRGRAR